MATYKDYGTPAEYSAPANPAGGAEGLNQKGNVTLTRSNPQYRGQVVPLMRAMRTKETATVWQIDGPQTLEVGNLNVLTGDRDEVINRFKIENRDGGANIELNWDGTTLSVNGTPVGATFELGAEPSDETVQAFQVDAEGNFSIHAGAGVSGDFVLSRIDGEL